MRGQAWTSRELAQLREHAHLGRHAVAALLGRSERSIVLAASRHGISLRLPGSRRGRRQAARVDPRAVEAIRLATERRPLCPVCVARPIDVPKAGTCQVCYRRELAQQHRDQAALDAASRELDAARQVKHRASKRAVE